MIFLNSIRQSSESNIMQVSNFILNTFSVKNSKFKLNRLFDSHLESNSLLAIKDVLLEYGIESIAINKGGYSYVDFETPFISAIQQEDWSHANFTVITDVNDKYVSYLDPVKNKSAKILLEEFEQIDKGIILLVDDNLKKDEVDYVINIRNQRRQSFIKNTPIYLILIAVLIAGLYIISKASLAESWYGLAFLLSSFVGVSITAILLWHEVNAHNPFIKEVCGGYGKKMNCDAVLSSAKAYFLGITWSQWGFAFMTTLFVSQIIYAGNLSVLLLSSYLSIAVLPYIVFSIYYQWHVVKQWCPLCLVVQILLMVNALIGISFINSGLFLLSQINYYTIASVIFIGILFLVSSYLLIPVLKMANDSRNFEKMWKKIRYNPEVFQTLLSKEKSINPSVEDMGILIGNPNAKNEIIKVCNPYCDPCSKVHSVLEHIISNNSDVKLRVIFNATGEEDDDRTLPVAHLLAIQWKFREKETRKALDEWYLSPEKNYNNFAEKYPMNGELEQQFENIKTMSKWCQEMKIRATPTVFLNGYELPDDYRISDLKQILSL